MSQAALVRERYNLQVQVVRERAARVRRLEAQLEEERRILYCEQEELSGRYGECVAAGLVVTFVGDRK